VFGWTPDEAVSLKLLDAFVASGVDASRSFMIQGATG
jgi:hypothetical protein